jgi:tryptophan synthase alpha chain
VDRIQHIAAQATGFIYLVSSLGVTGVRTTITTDISAIVSQIREVSDVPVAVGFGISTPTHVAQMGSQADGVIVGSAIVNIIAQQDDDTERRLTEYVTEMVNALQGSPSSGPGESQGFHMARVENKIVVQFPGVD